MPRVKETAGPGTGSTTRAVAVIEPSTRPSVLISAHRRSCTARTTDLGRRHLCGAKMPIYPFADRMQGVVIQFDRKWIGQILGRSNPRRNLRVIAIGQDQSRLALKLIDRTLAAFELPMRRKLSVFIRPKIIVEQNLITRHEVIIRMSLVVLLAIRLRRRGQNTPKITGKNQQTTGENNPHKYLHAIAKAGRRANTKYHVAGK